MAVGITKVDVARAAGVSRSAASMVLNGRRHTLSEDTVRNIRNAARQLGYHPAPKPLVRCVAFVAEGRYVLDPSDDLFQRITGAIMAELDERDYNVICVFLSDHHNRRAILPRILREGGVDGFLALPSRRASFEVIYERLLEMKSRAVFAAWRHDSVDAAGWVTSDDPEGSFDAARRVAQLGHKRVAILSGVSTKNPAALDRLEGHRQGLREFGITVPDEWVADGAWTREDGYRGMCRILDRGAPSPTAVLCANDWQALGAMDAARERGLIAPRDISFVGFDACRLAVNLSYARLTTVAQDPERVGRVAARSLADWAEGRSVNPPAICVPTVFQEGETLGPPRI